MSSSAQSTTYHSYSPVKMEGLGNPSDYDQPTGLNVISPTPPVPISSGAV